MKSNTLQLFIAILMVASLFSCNSETNNTSNTTDQLNSDKTSTDIFYEVEAPFEDVQIAYETITIPDPTQPFTLTTASGTTIDIPANAFVNETGQIITEAVDIKWRAFRNAADIITSGIPMRVNEKGEEGWMQTAGMFDIQGTSQNVPVQIAKEKALTVNFLSNEPGVYDAWIFDKEKGNWANLGPNEATPVMVDQAALAAEIAELEQKTKKRPVKPVVNPKEHMRFTDLNVDCCPDLSNKSAISLVQIGQTVVLPKQASWVDKVLKKTDKAGIYDLKLYGKDKVYTLNVKMPLQGASLKAANARYDALLAAYKSNIELLRNKQSMYDNRSAFKRTLRIQSFGIYNYDIIWKQQDVVPVYANFNFGELFPDELLPEINVFLITGEDRTVVDFPYYSWKRFSFSAGADNKLIAILPANKVAYFSQKDFEAAKADIIASKGKEYTFDMTIEEEKMESAEDLQVLIDKVSI